jgi:hypothetical protein
MIKSWDGTMSSGGIDSQFSKDFYEYKEKKKEKEYKKEKKT